MNRSLLSKLFRLHLLTPRGIARLMASFAVEGISLMAVLRFAAKYYPERIAVVCEEQRLSYSEFYAHARQMAVKLYAEHGLRKGARVGLMCRNHLTAALLLPALSRLGAHVKLLNTGLAPSAVSDLMTRLDLLIYDAELSDRLPTDKLPCATLTAEDLPHDFANKNHSLPRVTRGGNITVLTGASSGHYKEASRSTRVFQFLPPFFALLKQIHIDEYDSVAMPLPLYHGFGLATFIISLAMGKKIALLRHFVADDAMKLIHKERIQVLPVVPAMLGRLWQDSGAAECLRSIRCIICGGDRLDRKWADETASHLGNVLFNLYGTSEAGFFMLATPDDLARFDEVTIGRPIVGVKCRISAPDSHGTGTLQVRSGWAMAGLRGKWQDTGDLVSRNNQGYYFYRGRADNMVVCAGENVYPEHVEHVINAHPEVIISKVYADKDNDFGTVLNADVELMPDSDATADDIKAWIRPQLSRAELPHHITLRQVKVTDTGKIRR